MVKKLFSISLLALAFFVLSEKSNAQSIYFCESVSSDGYAVGESSVFNISRDGGYLDVLVRLPYEVACRSVRFEVYKNGNYDNTIYLDTGKTVWFINRSFYSSGSYSIYIYDCFDYMLTSGTVKIQYR
jgi:hypothetical protein